MPIRTSEFLFAASLLLPGAALIAQTPTPGAVCGTVRGPLFDPIVNAEVAVYTPDWQLLREGRTDGSGQYAFSGLGSGWVYVCARAPGLTRGCNFSRPLGGDASPVVLDVRMFDAAAVEGRVLDEDGAPIAGAQVMASLDEAWQILQKGPIEQVSTDVEGRYRLPNAPLGNIAVRASADGYELGEARLDLRDDASVDVTLQKGVGRTLEITVKGVPPERVEDIRCRWFLSREYPEPNMYVPLRLSEAQFGDEPQLRVTGLPRDLKLSMVRLEADGMRLLPQWQEVAAGQDGELTFHLDAITGPRPSKSPPGLPPKVAEAPRAPATPPTPKPPADPTLRGTLHDPSGKPVANETVRVYCDTTGWREAVTDAAGAFAIDAPYAPNDRLSFSLHDTTWALVGDDPNQVGSGSIWRVYRRDDVFEFVVAPAASVSGKVVAPRGYSAAGLMVRLETAGPTPQIPRMPRSFATTDERGAFTFRGLGASIDTFWLVVTGVQGTAEVGPLTLDGETSLDGVELELEPPMQITGKVVDHRGKPIPGARIELTGPGLTLDKDTLADRLGRFMFLGMSAGDYVVEVRVEGQHVAARSKRLSLGRKRRVDCKVKVPRR